ncbi:uncharacterized protein BKCO1_1900019 [Diplodia corticola]|uniref:Uncharacterized protein n=1 Tax=Diplodia corticola TaxID=236234 RepID=A0A1J9S684_9PEZI|nr:uncharacterized protein BKCO1_1900019 [Diplodia corticola]OJD35125.1 hypothetical protein BKCO1_1900019 [Diplodia corticola]
MSSDKKRKASTQDDDQDASRKKSKDNYQAAEKPEAAEALLMLRSQASTIATRPRCSYFRWNDLPGEIKNRIYAYALEDVDELVIYTPPQPIWMHSYHLRMWNWPHRSREGAPGLRSPTPQLLRVSRNVYREARLFLYQGNTIRFGTVYDFHAWMVSRTPVSIYIKNTLLWFDYHGTRVTYEIFIHDDDSGLQLLPITDVTKASILEATPNTMAEDFIDSIWRRSPRFQLSMTRLLAHSSLWATTVGAWRYFPAFARTVPAAQGKTIEISADLGGFWLQWPGQQGGPVRVS